MGDFALVFSDAYLEGDKSNVTIANLSGWHAEFVPVGRNRKGSFGAFAWGKASFFFQERTFS